MGRSVECRQLVVGNNRRPGDIRHGLGLLHDTLRLSVRLWSRLASSWHAGRDCWCCVVAFVAPCGGAALRVAFAYCAVARAGTIGMAAPRAFCGVGNMAAARRRGMAG